MTKEQRERRAYEISIGILYGGAEKAFSEQTEEEQKVSLVKTFENAKEKAFSRGLPIIWGKNGKVISQYQDGSMFLIIDGKESDIVYFCTRHKDIEEAEGGSAEVQPTKD